MAKRLRLNSIIKSPQDLITPRAEVRAGFISLALEKNYLAVPYVEEAKALKSLANRVSKPSDLLKIKELTIGLLTASGLSDKALNYLTEEDKYTAIKGLIDKYLEPAGDNFKDELVYRYLLTKGDTLGGKSRNLAGTLAERKFLKTLISVLNVTGVPFQWKDRDSNAWFDKIENFTEIEKRIKAIAWVNGRKKRLLIMNIIVPIVRKNVDLSVLKGVKEDYEGNKRDFTQHYKNYIALGELKGGIDPSGADEHWKSANSALARIKKSFSDHDWTPKTFFIGAAIENSMASEIFNQLKEGTINNVVNLTNDEQLAAICGWLIKL